MVKALDGYIIKVMSGKTDEEIKVKQLNIKNNLKNLTEQYKKLPSRGEIEEKIISVEKISTEIQKVINSFTPNVEITSKALKHIIERRGKWADDIIQAIQDILINPSKIADNSIKRPNSFLFIRSNGKAKSLVLEVLKKPDANQVVSAFYTDNKTYNKLLDISGRAAVPPSFRSGERLAASRISALQKRQEISLAQSKKEVKTVEKPIINLNRLNISPEARGEITEIAEQIKPELKKLKGGVMKNEEVIQAAKESEVLKKVVSKEATLKSEAILLKTRQQLAAMASRWYKETIF